MELSAIGDDEPGGRLAALESLYIEPEGPTEIDWGALEFHDVFKIYRSGPAETVALRGLDLRIEPREMVAIVGPSGSGKSTVLALAAAMDTPSAGEVRALRPLARAARGRTSSPTIARARSRSSSSRQPLAGLSARENVAQRSDSRGRSDAESAAAEALEAFGLGERQHYARRRSPAASSSAWRSPPPPPGGPAWSSPTSRPASWTRKRGDRARGAARATGRLRAARSSS